MSASEVTRLIHAMSEGDAAARDRLVPLVYDELRAMARGYLRGERDAHSLQPTDVVHQAYVRLVQGDPSFEGRAHFFGAAAQAMRRVLVDHARKRAASKRGGGMQPVTFHELGIVVEDPEIDVLALDEALGALASEEPRLAKIVQLRYFGGCTIAQVGELLGISPATVKRDWVFARAWLYERMTG